MKLTLLTGGAMAVLGGLHAEPIEIAYAPEEGTSVRRTFESSSEYSIDEVSISVDGEDHPDASTEGLPTIEALERIVMLDEIVSTEDGRPAELRRTFEEITEKDVYVMDEGEDAERSFASDVEGLTVLFTWDEDEREYALEFEQEDGDEELLEGLVEDMDLRALLPEQEVSPGDTWEADATFYTALMWPGGNLHRYDEEEGEPDPAQQELNEGVLENLDGTVTIRFEEVLEEDDLRLAVLALEIEVDSEAEIEVESEDEQLTDQSRGVALSRTVEGQALWDLDLGLFHSLTLEAESDLELIEAFTVEGPEGEVEVERTLSYTGAVDYEITFEVE